MSEKVYNGSQSTDDKMKELFDLMEEKAAAGELDESEEAPQPEEDSSPMSPSEASAYEYSMMMQQYEAMLLDYQRREAEEQAAKAEEQAEAGEDAEPPAQPLEDTTCGNS